MLRGAVIMKHGTCRGFMRVSTLSIARGNARGNSTGAYQPAVPASFPAGQRDPALKTLATPIPPPPKQNLATPS